MSSATRWTSWFRRCRTISPMGSSVPVRWKVPATHYVRVADLVQPLSGRDGAALSADPLRGHGDQPEPTVSRPCWASIGEKFDKRVPGISQEPALWRAPRATPR